MVRKTQIDVFMSCRTHPIASADAANTGKSSPIKAMSPTQFYDLLKQTKPSQVASNFGKPGEMITLKSATGEAKGVVWVYHNVVVAQKSL